MRFEVRGTCEDAPASASWDDGVVLGSDSLARRVALLVADQEVLAATPEGPFFVASLDEAEPALLTLVRAFDTVTEVEGAPDFSEADQAEWAEGEVGPY